MKEQKLWVIKYSNGYYSCGMKKFHPHLRHAQIYISKKLAEQQAQNYVDSVDRYTGKMIAPTSEFKIVEVKIMEVEDD